MCDSCQALAATSKFWLAYKAFSWLVWCVHGAVGLTVLRVLLGTVLHFRIFLVVFVWQCRWCMIHFFFLISCSHPVVFVWICAGQKGHLVVKWKIGDVNCKSNCFLREEILGDWTPEHYITQLYLNLSVCEIGLSVGLEFQNLRSFWIYPALFSSDWEQKSVLKWLIKLFSSQLFWVELETSFLDSLTCLVPSLQSRGVVPNNAQGKTKMGKKKKKSEILILLCCIVQKSGIFVFGGEVPEM